jgi:hypothetical protein
MSQTEQELSEALRNLVAGQPFEPDQAAIHRRGRRLRRRARLVRGAAGAGVVGVVAVAAAVAVSVSGPQTAARRQAVAASPVRHAVLPHAAPSHAAGTSAPGSQLLTLADYIASNAAKPAGDATLLLGTQSYPGTAAIPRADLYADNGTYYFAHTKSGLPAQVAGHHAVHDDGMFAREVAAAVFAGKGGNIATARQEMADAPQPPGTKPRVSQHDLNTPDRTGVIVTDNWVWENSMDALQAGAGNPVVRAGVLRLLATVPGISITHATSGGRQALVLTGSAPAQQLGYQEALTIDARTGVPIKFVGGNTGSAPSVVITYQVSRVTLSDVAAGKF